MTNIAEQLPPSPWLAGEDGCPGIAGVIDRTGHDERQQRIELPVLVDQMVAQQQVSARRQLVRGAGAALHRALAFMPGRGR